MRVSVFAAGLCFVLLGGCRYDPDKAPVLSPENETGEAYVIGENGSQVKGTVDVESVDGVPQLTVDMHGGE